MTVTESGLLTIGASQVYASLGEVMPDGGIGLRLYYKPLVLLIWLGAVVMALGGAISLTDRRMRVGAPARAQAKPLPAQHGRRPNEPGARLRRARPRARPALASRPAAPWRCSRTRC